MGFFELTFLFSQFASRGCFEADSRVKDGPDSGEGSSEPDSPRAPRHAEPKCVERHCHHTPQKRDIQEYIELLRQNPRIRIPRFDGNKRRPWANRLTIALS